LAGKLSNFFASQSFFSSFLMRSGDFMKYLFAVILTFALIAPAFAQKGPITLKSIAETETEVKNDKGVMEKKRAPAVTTIPGAQVIYTTTFTNDSGKPADNIAINNPIPANTVYVDGSAFGDNMTITFSVDAGKSFAAPEQLKMKTADGRDRVAVASDYTNIRWAYKGALAADKAGTAGFRVVIK
jgi:uncharacterized repeat protein (TIGR01451 family)